MGGKQGVELTQAGGRGKRIQKIVTTNAAKRDFQLLINQLFTLLVDDACSCFAYVYCE